MSDPVFETRAELIAWVKAGTQGMAWSPHEWLAVLERVRRVTLAHAHLGDEK